MIKTFYIVSIRTQEGIKSVEVSTVGDHPKIAEGKALAKVRNFTNPIIIDIKKDREEPCEIGNSHYD